MPEADERGNLADSLSWTLLVWRWWPRTGFLGCAGAFIMGSILAETVEAESIERLVKPVEDLSRRHLLRIGRHDGRPGHDCGVCGTYCRDYSGGHPSGNPLGTLGVLLAGKPLKTAMQCGFSLTQIGEFAFIIASLGVSLACHQPFLVSHCGGGVCHHHFPHSLYDSVWQNSASNLVDTHLPEKMEKVLDPYASGSQTMNHESLWKKLIFALVRITVVVFHHLRGGD